MMLPTLTLDDIELGPRPALGLRRENRGLARQRHEAITARLPVWGFAIDWSPAGVPLRMRPGVEQVYA